MLTELSIRNFAIIESLTLSFNEGLTVLTGETGAGKSIIIDAIQLLSGGRGSVEYIRHGESKATLEGLFTVDDKKHDVYALAEEFGIELNSDGMIVLHRTISQKGKNICRVNGSLVTLAILKEFGRVLIDVHTQHETQSLMDVDKHLQLLDLYSQKEIEEIFKDYTGIYHQLKKTKQRIHQMNDNEQEIAQRLDLLNFQLNELQAAELEPNEDEALKEERDRLANFERIFQGMEEAYSALNGEQKALDWLSLGLTGLEKASEFDDSVKSLSDEYSSQYFVLEDISHRIRGYLDEIEYDPERLNLVESRLNELQRLMRKYGSSVDEMLDYLVKTEEEIEQLENRDHSVQALFEQAKELAEDALAEARHLHDIRLKTATSLEKVVETELKDLYLEKAQFQVDIQTKVGQEGDPELDGRPVDLGSKGFDSIQFLLSTNPGEPVKPLKHVASGGELSRIMLALKKIFAKHQGVTSVIFDEVDTGVSGRVAQAIAEKIYSISSQSQVLCITHLPQVASMADTHVLIQKETTTDQTVTSVETLKEKERVEEIGRMMTGTELTETSTEHARELIHYSNQLKAKY
ncbi:DNA replication and repair protein RecN [Pelagirhabdus alkalitolerans]|uniref:DNA repair protein RecN n=1 Tax=Pelagirhabdus alkalitolerans TaxID=1612202 RepID=A0A1G6I4J9_9BACI|nr:DNA repair protein RecN [Pelagirhabdus alkalitolerans]SDC00656.1 DNA replication and repair protein RecN [Pelagirhabdus alkalitolerans]